jgi:hypothetical protein
MHRYQQVMTPTKHNTQQVVGAERACMKADTAIHAGLAHAVDCVYHHTTQTVTAKRHTTPEAAGCSSSGAMTHHFSTDQSNAHTDYSIVSVIIHSATINGSGPTVGTVAWACQHKPRWCWGQH